MIEYAFNNDIFADITHELKHQNRAHGGVTHDHTHSLGEWLDFRQKYENKILVILNDISKKNSNQKCNDKPSLENIRENLVKIAALAISQINALDLYQSVTL